MADGADSSADFLRRMAAGSQRRAAKARAASPVAELRGAIDDLPAPPALKLNRFDVIAEVKQRSPAAGGLAAADFDIGEQIAAYAAGGAAAISVLTEPDQFNGSLADLTAAARHLGPLGIPVMRKDFIVDAYQILEARAAGASGVLLIIAILDDDQLSVLMDQAEQVGLFVLLEAFSVEDILRGTTLLSKRPRPSTPILFGINCRDLNTLQIDFRRFETFSRQLPAGVTAVAESGLQQPDDAAKVARWGYSLALVGSALMRAADPAAALSAMVAAGREARGAIDVR